MGFVACLRGLSLAGLTFLTLDYTAAAQAAPPKPNVVVVIADQWREQAFGFAGDPNVKTPNFDRLAAESVWLRNAVSGLPVCSPMRASFLTGQRPLKHGVFLNDVPLDPEAVTLPKVLAKAGYDTAFIGKWHVNGDGRSNFIPRERRQGFQYWKALECTHAYNHSAYYGDTPEKAEWEGYDAMAQTADAIQYLAGRATSRRPFFLVLSWGPPHNPYTSAPLRFRSMYQADKLILRPNVPVSVAKATRDDLAGYYAHCSALDECLGRLREALTQTGLGSNTLVVFTSDHGDMLGSHGMQRKQKPYDESTRVPLLLHGASGMGLSARPLDTPFNSEDLMPTILGLCGVKIPRSVEGKNFSPELRGKHGATETAALLTCVTPFGEWTRRRGGQEYRGVRTDRYTYVRNRAGPWLLFDNQTDPFQTNNLVNAPSSRQVQTKLENVLSTKLKKDGDRFEPGETYIKKWSYQVGENGTVPYEK